MVYGMVTFIYKSRVAHSATRLLSRGVLCVRELVTIGIKYEYGNFYNKTSYKRLQYLEWHCAGTLCFTLRRTFVQQLQSLTCSATVQLESHRNVTVPCLRVNSYVFRNHSRSNLVNNHCISVVISVEDLQI